jgi:hypothetical protein
MHCNDSRARLIRDAIWDEEPMTSNAVVVCMEEVCRGNVLGDYRQT